MDGSGVTGSLPPPTKRKKLYVLHQNRLNYLHSLRMCCIFFPRKNESETRRLIPDFQSLLLFNNPIKCLKLTSSVLSNLSAFDSQLRVITGEDKICW